MVCQYFMVRLNTFIDRAPYSLNSYKRKGRKTKYRNFVQIFLTDDEYRHHYGLVNSLVSIYRRKMRELDAELKKEAKSKRKALEYIIYERADILFPEGWDGKEAVAPEWTQGKLVACTPPVLPRMFSPVHWFRAVPEEGATVVIYGADMIFNSYAAAVKAFKEAQEEKNCEIIFAWRDEDMPVEPPPVFFEAWDEMNPVKFQKEYMQQINTPIPVHTPFKVTKEDYYNNPRLMQDPLLLYCPAKGLAYKLDPEDPWDRRLLDAFNSANKMG